MDDGVFKLDCIREDRQPLAALPGSNQGNVIPFANEYYNFIKGNHYKFDTNGECREEFIEGKFGSHVRGRQNEGG